MTARECVQCEEPFVPPVGRSGWRVVTCSPECRRARRQKREKDRAARRTSEDLAQLAAKQRARRVADPERFRQYDRAKRERQMARTDPEAVRARKFRSWNKHLNLTYGIDCEDWARMFNAQGGLCAGCGDALRMDDDHGANVDHCHTTGRVRGLLCHSCNCSIGYAKDSVARLRGLILYLERK